MESLERVGGRGAQAARPVVGGYQSAAPTPKRVAGVEPPSVLPGEAPPAHDPVPWACVTCGGWVSHVDRVYTDEGLFHDRIACLSTDRFEELVLKYGCKCVETVSPHVVAVTL